MLRGGGGDIVVGGLGGGNLGRSSGGELRGRNFELREREREVGVTARRRFLITEVKVSQYKTVLRRLESMRVLE
jgi:hypothetical protein